jgi:hypothetical protein
LAKIFPPRFDSFAMALAVHAVLWPGALGGAVPDGRIRLFSPAQGRHGNFVNSLPVCTLSVKVLFFLPEHAS